MKVLLVLVFAFVFIQDISSQESAQNHPIRQNVEADPELEKYLREAMENFRNQMKEGIPAINMPVLDPLALQNLDLNVYENMATMELKIKELNVRCLSIFNITHLKPNLEEFFLEINLTLPVINVQGHYSVDGKFVKIFPIYGQGNFAINVTEINISGLGKLGFTTDTMQMSVLKLDLYWKKMTVFMENFLGGGNFSEVLQEVVPNVGRDIFHVYKPLIMKKLETFLQREVNCKLNQPEVKDIIKSIIPVQ